MNSLTNATTAVVHIVLVCPRFDAILNTNDNRQIVLFEGNAQSALAWLSLPCPPFPYHRSIQVFLTNNATGDISVSPSSVTFDSSSWNTSTLVTISPVEDAFLEGDEWFQIDALVIWNSSWSTNANAVASGVIHDKVVPIAAKVAPSSGVVHDHRPSLCHCPGDIVSILV